MLTWSILDTDSIANVFTAEVMHSFCCQICCRSLVRQAFEYSSQALCHSCSEAATGHRTYDALFLVLYSIPCQSPEVNLIHTLTKPYARIAAILAQKGSVVHSTMFCISRLF